MGPTLTEFESFEQQFIDVIGEFQSIMSSEIYLREAVRSEAARAETAEAASETAQRDAADYRANAAAAAAAVAQSSSALAAAHDELTASKSKLELTERQRCLLEKKCSELTGRIDVLEKEVQQLRPLQSAHTTLQRQYVELEGRVHAATEEARSETSRLESEVRRVEHSARGGVEVRERARLAAAAHARERHRSATDLQHTTAELLRANTEIARLGSLVSELQYRLSEYKNNAISTIKAASDLDSLAEFRAAFEAERTGVVKIERALASALADNATLAAQLHKNDNPLSCQTSHSKHNSAANNICAIDSFLAD